MIAKNAIIMAAGTSSRFTPLSAERPKGLVEVKGEILIERQIKQLHAAGIFDITIVVGYKAEMFSYLERKFDVDIVLNDEYNRYNNISSLFKVLPKLRNTFICSSDNYFQDNVFLDNMVVGYYSALFEKSDTSEYCLTIDSEDNITNVTVGGSNSWYMIGHAYFNIEFSDSFKQLIIKDYMHDNVKLGYWEDLYIKYIDKLPRLKVNRYRENQIFEFDSLDELREFDKSYKCNTRSSVIKYICDQLNVQECDVFGFKPIQNQDNNLIFDFKIGANIYNYNANDSVKIKMK